MKKIVMQSVNGYVIEHKRTENRWTGLILGIFGKRKGRPIVLDTYRKAYNAQETAYCNELGFWQFRVRRCRDATIAQDKHGAYYVINGFEK